MVDNQFWLQVMGDHAIMIYQNLSPLESQIIKQTEEFIRTYNELMTQARTELTDDQVRQLIQRALETTRRFLQYKSNILSKQLTEMIRLSLSTGIINHMINEANEYLYILSQYAADIVPKFSSVHYHVLWLRDALEHSNIIESFTGFPYREVSVQAHNFTNTFEILYSKAFEFNEYMRTGLKYFPAIDQLNTDAYNNYSLFAEFLVDLILKIDKKRIVIPLNMLFIDHMYREACYYLTQLADVSESRRPTCDPAAPRRLFQA